MTTSLWVVLYCLYVSSEMNRPWYGKVLGALTWMPSGINAPSSIASTELMVSSRAEQYICYPLSLAQLLCDVSFTFFAQRSLASGVSLLLISIK